MADFMCGIGGCERGFDTERGLSLHQRSAHATEYHSRASQRISSRGTFWAEEEVTALVNMEAELVLQGISGRGRGSSTGRGRGRSAVTLNGLLTDRLGTRTLDAIKGQRRKPEYKLRVERLCARLRVEREAETTPRLPGEGGNSQPRGGAETSGYLVDTAMGNPEMASALHPHTDNIVTDIGDVSSGDRLTSFSGGSADDNTALSRRHVDQLLVSILQDLRDPPGGDRFTTCRASLRGVLDNFGSCEWPLPAEDRARLTDMSDASCGLLISQMKLDNAARSDAPDTVNRHDRQRPRGRPAGRNPVFSTAPAPGATRHELTRTQLRRKQFKTVQAAFGRSSGEAAKLVFSGNWRANSTELDPEIVLPYWKELFERASPPDVRPFCPVRDSQWQLYEPITVTEVANMKKSTLPSSNGPDDLSLDNLQDTPSKLLTAAFNIWMVLEDIPSKMRSGRTTLIPKVPTPLSPSEFRPITVSSHLARLFNKILNARLSIGCPVNAVQKAFQPLDGCQQNVSIIDAIIGRAKSFDSEVNLAFLDMRKAFDSVGHPTIDRAMKRAGVPAPLRTLIMSGYDSTTTTFKVGGVVTTPCNIGRGVKQGDPLSPLLFNLVIDELASEVQSLGVGVRLSPTVKVSLLAFADDLVLVGETKFGLQMLVRRTLDVLEEGGLEVNPAKCKTLALVVDKHCKSWAVSDEPFLALGDGTCQALGPLDTYKYLGIRIGPSGRAHSESTELERCLEEIRRAPLKPQQRLVLLVKHLIPKLQHCLVLGKVYKTQLARMDRRIRVSLRNWLKLPHDSIDAFLYAPVDAGGIGVPRLETRIAFAKQARLNKLMHSGDEVLIAVTRLHSCVSDIRYWSDQVTLHGTPVRSNEDVDRFHTAKLYSMLDGKGLKPAKEFPRGNSWLKGDLKWISGSDYIKLIQVRCNAIATPARNSRGRPENSGQCMRCAPSQATLGHISQVCQVTSALRTARHDDVVRYVARALGEVGWTISVEPRLLNQEDMTLRQPDLVCTKDDELIVLDVQVCADGFAMTEPCRAKELKYSTDSVRRCIETRWHRTPSKVTGLILNWRGLWHGKSAKTLLAMGLNLGHLAVCSVKSLTWTQSIWRSYKRTGMRRLMRNETVRNGNGE